MTMQGPSRPVLLAVEGGVATITLNRPQRRNALDFSLVHALAEAVQQVEIDPSVRVLMIRGAGAAFCSGGDLAYFHGQGDKLGPSVDSLLRTLHVALLRLTAMAPLCITCVHGAAAGAGLSLAMAADFCIAADDATFWPSYARLGVTPDGGGTFNAVRLLGVRKAMQLFLMEEKLSAAEAQSFGLVSRVVPADGFDTACRGFAERMATLDAEAVQRTRVLLRAAARANYADHLEIESGTFVQLVQRPVTRHAIEAYVAASREPRT